MNIQDDITKVNSVDYKKYRSSPLMTRYEFNQIISLRTEQIAQGAPIFLEDEEVLTRLSKVNGNMPLREIAERELLVGRLPAIVRRPMPNGKYEYWRVKDLDITPVRRLFRHVNMALHFPTITTI